MKVLAVVCGFGGATMASLAPQVPVLPHSANAHLTVAPLTPLSLSKVPWLPRICPVSEPFCVSTLCAQTSDDDDAPTTDPLGVVFVLTSVVLFAVFEVEPQLHTHKERDTAHGTKR